MAVPEKKIIELKQNKNWSYNYAPMRLHEGHND